MLMRPRPSKLPKRFTAYGRRAFVAATLCAALAGLLPAGASQAATTTADVVLVDLSFDRAAVGTPYSYVFEVDNWGPDSASQVGFTAVVHGISSFETVSSDHGTCTYVHSSNTVNCEIGELASGASATVEIVVTPSDHTDNTATVSTATGEDPDTSNNSATSSPLVLAAGSLLRLSMRMPDELFGGRLR